jgi:hypothetical protein
MAFRWFTKFVVNLDFDPGHYSLGAEDSILYHVRRVEVTP